jgi:hypothetical protein
MRGKSSTYQDKVLHDHKSAKYLLTEPDKIMEVNEDGVQKWRVPSSTGIGHYGVKRVNDDCGDQCHVRNVLILLIYRVGKNYI